jgi:hypothetical protein
VAFDPHDEQRWAAMPEDERLAEHERLRDVYLSQLEERVLQMDAAKRQIKFVEGDLDRVRDLLKEHNARLPMGKRQAAKSDRQILGSNSDRVRAHRASLERTGLAEFG